jgi:hypothetical protein
MQVDLGTAFGERKQLANMLGDTATNLAKAFRYVRRGQVRRAMNQLGISRKHNEPIGGSWVQKILELRYGWIPSLSDVYSAADTLSKRGKGDWRITAKATRKADSEYVYRLEPLPTTNFDACSVTAKVMRSAFVRIDAVPDNELLISLANVGVLNPLQVAWELVPFSFVVDWGWALGNWIESLDAMLGYTQCYTSTSFLVRADWEDTGLSKEHTALSYTRNHYEGRKKLVYLNRSALSGVPLPTLPRIKDPRSYAHMANGLALLAQSLGRFHKPIH